MTAVIPGPPRHEDIIGEVREGGALRIRSSPTATSPAPSPPYSSRAPSCWASVARPKVIAAAALKCMGGEMQGRLWPRNDEERQEALDQSTDRILDTDDLVEVPTCFAATGITDGELLKGVHQHPSGASTQSLVMRSVVGHRATDRRPPQTQEAEGVHLSRLRLGRVDNPRIGWLFTARSSPRRNRLWPAGERRTSSTTVRARGACSRPGGHGRGPGGRRAGGAAPPAGCTTTATRSP